MYEKRLCILKQVKNGFTADGAPLCGAVYAERIGAELILTPKISGLSPLKEGRYALGVNAGGREYCLELKGNEPLRLPECPPLDKGFSVVLAFVRKEAEAVAYGFCGAPVPMESLMEIFSGREGKRPKPIPSPPPPNEIPVSPSPQVPLGPKVPPEPPHGFSESRYDDEAIASENYFPDSSKEEGPCENSEEDGAYSPFRLSRGGLTYYHSIAQKLDEAMKKFPRSEKLAAVFPHSEWVQAGEALLGVIYAEGVPRYLCVALKSELPPEAAPYGVFVPESPYTDEEGYNVVFQDADTGEYVKAEEG